MIQLNKVTAYMGIVILFNLVVLYTMFLKPRDEYMKTHSNWSEREIKEDSGTSDLPNIFVNDYQLAYKIKDWTPENSIIWIESKEKKPINKSVAGQVLYPRKIVWNNKNFSNNYKKQKHAQSRNYLISHKIYMQKCNPEFKIRYLKNEWILCEIPYLQ